jgi:uncharacterized protein (DUF1499 family)
MGKIFSIITPLIVLIFILGRFYYLGQLSKEGQAPGLVAGRLAPCPETPNCVSSDATGAAQAIAPLVFDPETITAAAAWEKVQEAVKSLPGARIIKVTPTYLNAECTSGTFGFVDYLELLLNLERAEISLRSGSRVGNSDFGANRKRVELLREKFQGKAPGKLP